MRRPARALVALVALTGACTVRPATKVPAPRAVQSDAGPEAIYEEFGAEQAQRIAAVRRLVDAAAKRHDLEPELILGVIWVESRFVVDARSPAGARGLMQLMPPTAAALAKELGVARPRSDDPSFNIDAGSYYLRRLLDRFEQDEILALAAYHAGAGNVRKWLAAGQDLPDFSRKYVDSVLEARARFRGTPLPASREIQLARAEPIPPPPSRPEAPPPRPPVLPPRAPAAEEPIFEPRPDLDVAPSRPGPGRSEPAVRPSPEPRRPAPRRPAAAEPAAAADPAVGPGILPSITD